MHIPLWNTSPKTLPLQTPLENLQEKNTAQHVGIFEKNTVFASKQGTTIIDMEISDVLTSASVGDIESNNMPHQSSVEVATRKINQR